MSTDTDVIVIGAGAAGLSTARALAGLGRSAIVIESLHRIGGRAYSEEIAPGTWFDLGCSYLHNGDINPFAEIADALECASAASSVTSSSRKRETSTATVRHSRPGSGANSSLSEKPAISSSTASGSLPTTLRLPI